MFENMKSKIPNQQPQEEQFLLVISDVQTYAQYFLLVPGRKAFAELLTLLPAKKYYIAQVTLLANVKDYDKFIKELKEESKLNKPDGLNFG